MESSEIFELAKKNFVFLFRDYGFVVDRYDKGRMDSCVILKSNYFRMKFGTERGDIYVAFKFLGGEKWYSAGHLLPFLTKGTNQFDWIRDVDSERKYLSLQPKEQMAIQVKVLEPYWEDIFEFFKEGNVREKEKELDAFIRKQWDKSEVGKFTNKAAKEYEEKHPETVAETRKKIEAYMRRVKAEQGKKKVQDKK